MRNYIVKRNPMGLFDEAFDDFFKPTFYNMDNTVMKTDVKESKDGYTLEIEMPGYIKDDIHISMEDGYVSVSAAKTEKEEDKENRYIRKERSVSCSRSYYVGDVEEKDVKAKFENGVLTLTVPKPQEKLPEKHHIAIE